MSLIKSPSTQPNTELSSAAPKPRANMGLLFGIVLLSALLLCVLMFFSGNRQAYAYAETSLFVAQEAQVNISTIKLQDTYVKPRTVFGRLRAAQQSSLGFELGGLLQQVHVNEGDLVVSGDILARIDTSRIVAQENELLSALKSAQANAKLAKISAERVIALVNNKLEPEQRLDEASAQLDAANAVVSEAKARLASVQVEIEKSLLRAPFDGQIVKQNVDRGTVLSQGQGVFSILAVTQLEAQFGLPEQTGFDLRVGQILNLDVSGITLPARVSAIVKERQLATRTLEAIFEIDLEDLTAMQRERVVSGDLISLKIDIPKSVKGAWVPITALATGIRGMWTLYVVNNDNVIETRIVSIEYAEQERAYVVGAIKQGDKLVVTGPHRLTPHQHVNKVVEVDMHASVVP